MARPRQRSNQRDRVLALVQEACHDRFALLVRLDGIASATLDRLLQDLRVAGYPIVSVRRGRSSLYMLLEEALGGS